MQTVMLQTKTRTKDLADVKIVTDVILYYEKDKTTYIYLPKRNLPPYMEQPSLPGGFLWEKETPKECAERVLKQKVSISAENLVPCFVADDPTRDARGHIISFVFKKLMSTKDIANLNSQDMYPLSSLPETAFDHADIIRTVFGV